MNTRARTVVAMIGLHGVGKTTLSGELIAAGSGRHVNVGDFLRGYLRSKMGRDVTREESRVMLDDVDTAVESMRALVTEIRHASEPLVVVDTGSYLVELGTGFYHSSFHFLDLIGVDLIVTVLCEPEEMRRRRTEDAAKRRATEGEDVTSIRRRQEVMVAASAARGMRLGVPVAFVYNDSLSDAVGAVQKAVRRLSVAEDADGKLRDALGA